MEECLLLRARDARAKRLLLLFENAEDAQGTPQAAQAMPARNLHVQGMPAGLLLPLPQALRQRQARWCA